MSRPAPTPLHLGARRRWRPASRFSAVSSNCGRGWLRGNRWPVGIVFGRRGEEAWAVVLGHPGVLRPGQRRGAQSHQPAVAGLEICCTPARPAVRRRQYSPGRPGIHCARERLQTHPEGQVRASGRGFVPSSRRRLACNRCIPRDLPSRPIATNSSAKWGRRPRSSLENSSMTMNSTGMGEDRIAPTGPADSRRCSWRFPAARRTSCRRSSPAWRAHASLVQCEVRLIIQIGDDRRHMGQLPLG